MFSLTNRTFRNSLRDDGSTATSLNISIYHESTIFQNFPIYLFQVKGDVYLYYFRSVGGWLSFFTLLLYVAYQVPIPLSKSLFKHIEHGQKFDKFRHFACTAIFGYRNGLPPMSQHLPKEIFTWVCMVLSELDKVRRFVKY